MNEQEEARWLAEKVLGWRQSEQVYISLNSKGNPYCSCTISNWHPRIDIAQAMMLVDKFPSYSLHKNRHGTFHCVLWAEDMTVLGASDFEPTPAEAICAAAIKTVKKEE